MLVAVICGLLASEPSGRGFLRGRPRLRLGGASMPAVAGVLPFLEPLAAGLATVFDFLPVVLVFGAALVFEADLAFGLATRLVAVFATGLAADFDLAFGGAAPLLRLDFAFPVVAGEAFGFAGDACLLDDAFFVAIIALREEGWVPSSEDYSTSGRDRAISFRRRLRSSDSLVRVSIFSRASPG